MFLCVLKFDFIDLTDLVSVTLRWLRNLEWIIGIKLLHFDVMGYVMLPTT